MAAFVRNLLGLEHTSTEFERTQAEWKQERERDIEISCLWRDQVRGHLHDRDCAQIRAVYPNIRDTDFAKRFPELKCHLAAQNKTEH